MAVKKEKEVTPSKFKKPKEFPYTTADKERLADYHYFFQLFEGDHFNAFRMRVSSRDYNTAYAKLKYIYVNFAGMISRIVADMLFGEPVKPKSEDKKTQEFLDEVWTENAMNILLYENALDNSAKGDAILKLRVGPRRKGDKNSTVIIEQNTASIYFPHIDGFNVSAEPDVKELAWIIAHKKEKIFEEEIHEIGKITNELYLMKGAVVDKKVNFSLIGMDIPETQDTGIDRHLIIHIPNWKTGSKHFGYSDYNDLDAIFFAINNRISKVDNVLDTHTDPFLMVPHGIIGEDGKVKKDGRIIEMGEGETKDGKPEYIVWDASLENAFKQIDKLVEFMYMIGEVSPDILGMGKGKSDSGRALKFKLMRTIAKISRKKLYYDKAIKEALLVAELLAKKHGLVVNGKSFKGEAVKPELIWQDGLPSDEVEIAEVTGKEMDSGITSQIQGIMRVHQVDEKTATTMAKTINEEKKASMPEPLDPKRNPFSKRKSKEDVK